MTEDDPILLTPAEAAEYLKISVSTLERMRSEGSGPPFVRTSARRVLYQRAALEGWVAAGGFKRE